MDTAEKAEKKEQEYKEKTRTAIGHPLKKATMEVKKKATLEAEKKALPKKPEASEPGYSASPDKLEMMSAKEQELENFHLTICAEVEARWGKGYRKEIGTGV